MRWSLALAGAMAGLSMLGCQIPGFFVESYRRESTHEIKGEYRGLEGKDFAVVVTADRVIQAENPELVGYLTYKITEKLAGNDHVPRAGGFVPPEDVLRYTYANPGWTGKPMSDLAKGLGGVKRLVYVEVYEYQLHDAGNQYEWDGVAAGTISVIETDTNTPNDFAFQRQVTVKYPDKKGYGPTEIAQGAVQTVLASRFVDRTAWLMFDHQEKYYPDY
jgi:hypothetical protein